jgi:hypothetical protein
MSPIVQFTLSLEEIAFRIASQKERSFTSQVFENLTKTPVEL